MKFNLCTVAITALALCVTARPATEEFKAKSIVLRQDGKGMVGDLFRRERDDDGLDSEDKDDVEDEDVDKDEDADKDEDQDADEDAGENADENADEDADEAADDQDEDEESSTITGRSSAYATATKTSDSSGSTSTSTGSSSSLTAGLASSSSSGSSSVGSLPASSGSTALSAVQTIAPGESFDGGFVVYDRGVSCTGKRHGGESDAVFQIEDGGSLSNVIIGPNQIEGVHCQGACTLTNVWWSAVCEDALTVKKQEAGETTTISGGGAFGADDNVIQHNGGGTVAVSNFTVDDFGTLYQSCGNCDSMYERHVTIDGVTATSGELLASINPNYGDTATITNVDISDVDEICEQFEGNDTGDEPTSIATGADGTYCIYSSDITTA